MSEKGTYSDPRCCTCNPEGGTEFDALTVIHAFQAEGWSDHTLVLLLADFINAEKLSGPLNAYLNRLWNETVDIQVRDTLARRSASDADH